MTSLKLKLIRTIIGRKKSIILDELILEDTLTGKFYKLKLIAKLEEIKKEE